MRDVHVKVKKGSITAFIGPSGCGKSTALRCLNRMNDLVRGFRFKGHVLFHGQDIYGSMIDPVAVRRNIGMVFQQPNPFAMSITRNVAFGLRLNGYGGAMEPKVEQALRQAALWDEVKDKLKSSGLSLSGGQQQRLCIARAIATEPSVLLMDEPCSALDPIATRRIEDLMQELKKKYTIAIVTHNLQQAKRVADMTGVSLRRYNPRRPDRLHGRVRTNRADLRRPPARPHQGVHPRRIQLARSGINPVLSTCPRRPLREQSGKWAWGGRPARPSDLYIFFDTRPLTGGEKGAAAAPQRGTFSARLPRRAI